MYEKNVMDRTLGKIQKVNIYERKSQNSYNGIIRCL